MNIEDFRKYGYDLIDWIVNYYKNIESYPVLSNVKPNQIRKLLPANPPHKGEPFEAILKDIDDIIIPGITHWQSPNFFAFFPANTSGPSILGELLSAGLGVQGMLWATSPACTELETHVLDWVAYMLSLPSDFFSTEKGGGVIQDSASSSAICAILSAREKITSYSTNQNGCNGLLTAYISSQTHSSIEKAIKITGIGKKNLRLVDIDDYSSMLPEDLDKKILEDKKLGNIPFFVCATVGTTSSNAIDPLGKIGNICKKYNLWMHVDAAMSGSAAICPEFRYILNGIEFADSFCFNPHKWLFTNFDCDCFYIADRKILINTLSILPEYLKNQATESGSVIDYRDWQISLGRRFRALKLWFVIRYYGIDGLRSYIRKHIDLAQKFGEMVKSDKRFEIMAPYPLNLVCFRLKGSDEINQKLINDLNQSGKIYLTHTKIYDKFTLRFCVGQTNTELKHIEKAWELIKEYGITFTATK